MISEKTGRKLDSEITAVCNTLAFDPERDTEKLGHIIAVGWDK